MNNVITHKKDLHLPHPQLQIIISSDSNLEGGSTPVYHNTSYPQLNSPNQDIKLLNYSSKDECQEERRKQEKLNNIKEMMKEIQQSQKKQAEEFKEVLAKKASKDQERQAQKVLRKDFETHGFLPIGSLVHVKRELQYFQLKCKFQELPPELRTFVKQRQQNRRRLTRVMLLTIQQLRYKTSETQTNIQNDLLSHDADTLPFCYQLAKQIETNFFKRLFKSASRSSENYQRQIKLVLKEFNDKNNIEFRRAILNQQIDYKELSQATDESLKCQKTKEEEKAKIQQLIRESEKEFNHTSNALEPEEEPIYRYNSMSSMNSVSFGLQEQQKQKQTQQQLCEREKHTLLQKTKAIYKRCEKSMVRRLEIREERMEGLREGHERNKFFVRVWEEKEM